MGLLYWQGLPGRQLWAVGVFAAASFTDFLDGYLARRDHLVTDFGKLMDPLADKLLVISALVCFIELGYAPALAVVVILARELTVTSIRLVAAGGGRVIAADRWGKYKTVSQMAWVMFTLVHRWAVEGGLAAPDGALFAAEAALMALTVGLTVLSGCNYVVKNRDIFMKSM